MNLRTMKVWMKTLDNQINANKCKVLMGDDTVSHKEAIEKAGKEFETYYRQHEMSLFESDFDRAIKMLKEKDE